MFDQSPYQFRVEWGFKAARDAAFRGDVVVIVDVLSFSTTTIAACQNGAQIYPFPYKHDGRTYAESLNAELVVGRTESTQGDLPSLSPESFNLSHADRRFVLCSLNGARCAQLSRLAPAVLVGALTNASAVGEALMKAKGARAVTIVPCGEQWSDAQEDDNVLRPSLEDYLGAGAILSGVNGTLSPEAELCRLSFQSAENRIESLVWECCSGRELRERGFNRDVAFAVRLNSSQCVPVLRDDHFCA